MEKSEEVLSVSRLHLLGAETQVRFRNYYHVRTSQILTEAKIPVHFTKWLDGVTTSSTKGDECASSGRPMLLPIPSSRSQVTYGALSRSPPGTIR